MNKACLLKLEHEMQSMYLQYGRKTSTPTQLVNCARTPKVMRLIPRKHASWYKMYAFNGLSHLNESMSLWMKASVNWINSKP